MSHNIHIFLTNQDKDLCESILTVDNALTENMPNFCDYFRVLGVIDLNTDEYKEWMNTVGEIWSKIKSKNDLEEFANSLYSKEYWDRLKSDLERFIKSDLFWSAKCVCEKLDGISYAKSLGFPKWSADPDKAFAINDGYYDLSGISDWRLIENLAKNHTFAVIVDFHS